MKRYLRDPNLPAHLRELVESARTDGLDEDRRRRVAERLGLTLAVPGPAPTTVDGRSVAASSWPSVGTLALAVMALAGGSVGFMRASRSEPTEPPAAVSPAAATSVCPPVPTPAPSAKEDAVRPDTIHSTDVTALPDVRPETTVAKPRVAIATAEAKQTASSDLRLEIAALDGARRATESGRPRDSLALLDDYAAKFPAGKLGEEAAVLRIEALHAAGDQPAANVLARRLLRDSPNTPYGARVRAALDEPPR